MNKTISQILFLLFTSLSVYSQTYVSITIDDVPNTRKFEKDNYHSVLLNTLDSLNIPIAIFINEGGIYKTDSISKNVELLNNWIQREYVTAGNHSFSHSRYSDIGYTAFKNDIEKGEYITRELTHTYHKVLNYFRFPYNDLGKDSVQHKQMADFLKKCQYLSTPFTIESSDWMFNYVYEHFLQKSDMASAAEIGHLYVEKTIAYFHFFDSLSMERYGRKIHQIYLCHDNTINADYLAKLINRLKKQGYHFISLEKALEDRAYVQENNYHKKWGISWMYRWMPTQLERVAWMKKEPDINSLIALYNRLIAQKKNGY